MDPVLEPLSIPTSDAMDHGIVPLPMEVDGGDGGDPTMEPTAVPLALFAFLKQETDGTLESSTNLVLIAVFGAAFMTVLSAMVFMKAIKESESRMMVDDQDLISVLLYVLQIVDIFSDLVFALQCRVYWEYALTDDDDQVEPDDFMWLWRFALLFVLIPYGGNLLSSIKMTHAIAQDDHISSHSKVHSDREMTLTVDLEPIPFGFVLLGLLLVQIGMKCIADVDCGENGYSKLFEFSCLHSLKISRFSKKCGDFRENSRILLRISRIQ